jgi:hypothetical protein
MLAIHQTTALSHVGGYFPCPYVPLGVAERATNDPDAAAYAGRVASGVLCIALLALAFGCLRTRWQRAGWLCMLTPITL